MTKRRQPEGVDGRVKYGRYGSQESCDHAALEPHVTYDMQASGYRAQLRCRCTKVKIEGKKVREQCARAEEDAKTMLSIVEAHIDRKVHA